MRDPALVAEVRNHSLYARCQLLLDLLQSVRGWVLLANLKVVQIVKGGP